MTTAIVIAVLLLVVAGFMLHNLATRPQPENYYAGEGFNRDTASLPDYRTVAATPFTADELVYESGKDVDEVVVINDKMYTVIDEQ